MSPDFDAFVISPLEVIKSEPLLGRGEVGQFGLQFSILI